MNDPLIPNDRLRRRLLVTAFVALAILGLTEVRHRARADAERPERGSDFTCYTEAGAALLDGRDPYAVTNPQGWYYLYPPLFAIVVSPLHRFDAEWQHVAWYFLCVVMLFGCYWESVKLTRAAGAGRGRSQPLPVWLRVMPVLAVAAPVNSCLHYGNTSILLTYLLLLAARLALTGPGRLAWVAAGIALAGATAIKLTPALPSLALVGILLLLGRRGGRRTDYLRRARWVGLGLGAGLGAFLFVVPAAFVGWSANLQHLDTFTRRVVIGLDSGQAMGLDLRRPGNQSVRYVVGGFTSLVFPASARNPADTAPLGNTPGVPAIVRLIHALVAALLAAVAWRMSGPAVGRPPLAVLLVFGVATQASLVFSPIVWFHHYVLQLLCASVVPLWLWQQGRDRSAFVMAVMPLTFIAVRYGLKLTPLEGLFGVLAMFWLVAACVLVLRGREDTVPTTDTPLLQAIVN